MTVMVGVDGSPGARAALRWAARRAAATGSPLTAVTAWQYPRTAALPGGPELRPAGAMDESTAGALAEVVMEELGEAAANVETVVERGPADWVLLDVAARDGAELLVVGKRGLGSLEGRLLGSVSRRVAELAPCPAVIVSTGDARSDGPVVVGVDGSPAATAAREWATATAAASGTRIVLVHGVAGLPAELPPSAIDRFVDQARQMVAEHAKAVRAAGVGVDEVVVGVDPRLLIDEVAAERGASLVVVGAAGDGPAGGLLIGSVVNHVVQQSECPVAIVPEAV